LLLITAAAVILFFCDPLQSSFYPQCMFRKTTGWSCPACGCLRASHQLLHGNVADAVQLNALFVILIPILGWISIRQLSGRRSKLTSSKVFGWSLLVVVILFGVLRNLPALSTWSAR
jgi:hypothetical protein